MLHEVISDEQFRHIFKLHFGFLSLSPVFLDETAVVSFAHAYGNNWLMLVAAISFVQSYCFPQSPPFPPHLQRSLHPDYFFHRRHCSSFYAEIKDENMQGPSVSSFQKMGKVYMERRGEYFDFIFHNHR